MLLHLRGERALDGLPNLEAVPAELVGGPDLVGEPVRVHPTFLLGPPAAVPSELEHAGLTAAFYDHGTNEIGAAGSRVEMKAFDRPFGMGVQELIDEPQHLDARHDVGVRDRRRVASRQQRGDVSFEAIGSRRPCQELVIDWHGRNISTRLSNAEESCTSLQTKLTARSAQPFSS